MPVKMNKKKFLQLLQKQADENMTVVEVCQAYDISRAYFYKLSDKYKQEIVDLSKDMARRAASEQVGNLKRNAKKGDTRASQLLLEMGGAYTPKQEVDNNFRDCGTVTLPAKKAPGAPTEAKNSEHT